MEVLRIGILATATMAIPAVAGMPLARWLGDPWPQAVGRLTRLGAAYGIGLAWIGLTAWSCGIAGLSIAAFTGVATLVPLWCWWKAVPAQVPPAAHERPLLVIALVAVALCLWRGARLGGTDELLYMGWIRDHAHARLVLPQDPFGQMHDGFWLGRTPWHFLIGMALRLSGLEIDRAWDWLPALLVVPFLISLHTFLLALGCRRTLRLATLALVFVCTGGSRYGVFTRLAWSRLGPLCVLWLAFAWSIRWLDLGERRALMATTLLVLGACCLNLRYAIFDLLAIPGLMAASAWGGPGATRAWSLLKRGVVLAAVGVGAAVLLSLPFHLHHDLGRILPGPPVAVGIAPYCLYTSEGNYILDPTIPQVAGDFGACGLVALAVLASSFRSGWTHRSDLRALVVLVAVPLTILFNPWVFPTFTRIYVLVHDSERLLDPIPWPAALAEGLLFLGVALGESGVAGRSLAKLAAGGLCALALIPQTLCRIESSTPSYREAQRRQSLARFAENFKSLDGALAPGTRVLAGPRLTDAIPAFTSWSVIDGGYSVRGAFEIAGEEIPYAALRALVKEPGQESRTRQAMIEERLNHVLLCDEGATKSESTAARLVASGEFTRVTASGPLTLLAIRAASAAPPRAVPRLEHRRAAGPADVTLTGCRVTLGDGPSGPGLTLRVRIAFSVRGTAVPRPTPFVEFLDSSYRSDPLYGPTYGRLYLFLKGVLTGRRFRFVEPVGRGSGPLRWDAPSHEETIAIDLSFLHEGMGREPYDVRVGATRPGEPLRRWLRLDEPDLPCAVMPGKLRKVLDGTGRGFHFHWEASAPASGPG